MPTARRRHQITETAEIEAAVDLAAQRFPNASRAELVRRLILEGADALESSADARSRARLDAIDRTAGTGTEDYGPGYLRELREDWPA